MTLWKTEQWGQHNLVVTWPFYTYMCVKQIITHNTHLYVTKFEKKNPCRNTASRAQTRTPTKCDLWPYISRNTGGSTTKNNSAPWLSHDTPPYQIWNQSASRNEQVIVYTSIYAHVYPCIATFDPITDGTMRAASPKKFAVVKDMQNGGHAIYPPSPGDTINIIHVPERDQVSSQLCFLNHYMKLQPDVDRFHRCLFGCWCQLHGKVAPLWLVCGHTWLTDWEVLCHFCWAGWWDECPVEIGGNKWIE